MELKVNKFLITQFCYTKMLIQSLVLIWFAQRKSTEAGPGCTELLHRGAYDQLFQIYNV
jgi:hypothetical protein